MDIKEKLKKAESALKKKKWNEAFDITDNILMYNATNYKALLIHAQSLVGLGRLPEAIAVFKRAIEDQEKPIMAYYGLSQVYKDMRKHDEQLLNLKKVLEFESYFPALIEALKCCQRLKKLQLGNQIASEFLKNNQLSKKQDYQLHLILYHLNKDFGRVSDKLFLKLLSLGEDVHMEFFLSIFNNFSDYSKTEKMRNKKILIKLTNDYKIAQGYALLAQFDSAYWNFNPLHYDDEQIWDIITRAPSDNGWKSIVELKEKAMELSARFDEDDLDDFVVVLQAGLKRDNLIVHLFVHLLFYSFEIYDLVLDNFEITSILIDRIQATYDEDLSAQRQFLVCLALGSIRKLLYSDSNTLDILNLATDLEIEPNLIILIKCLLANENQDFKKVSEYTKSLKNAKLNDEDKADYYYCLSQLSFHANDFDEADKYVSISLKLNPDSSKFLMLRGKCALFRNELEVSYTYFTRVINFEENADAFAYLGLYFSRINDMNKARKCYQKALSLDDSHPIAAEHYVKEALNAKISHQNMVDILQTSEKVTRIDPSAFWAYEVMAKLFFQLKDYDKCIDACQSCIRMSKDLLIYEYMAESLFNIGKFSSALNTFNTLLELSPSDYLKIRIAALYLEIHDFDKCLCLIEDISELQESVSSLRCNAIRMQLIHNLNSGCTTKALLCLDRLFSIKSNSLSMYDNLSSSILCILKVPESIYRFTISRLMKIYLDISDSPLLKFPLKVPSEKSALLSLIALKCALNARNFCNAAISFKILFKYEIFDDNTVFELLRSNLSNLMWIPFGQYCVVSRRLALAQHAFVTEIKLKNSDEAWLNLGVLYLQKNELDIAKEALRKSRDINPKNVQTLYYLAFINHLCNDYSKAIIQLIHILSLKLDYKSLRLLILLSFKSNIVSDNIQFYIRQYISAGILDEFSYMGFCVLERGSSVPDIPSESLYEKMRYRNDVAVGGAVARESSDSVDLILNTMIYLDKKDAINAFESLQKFLQIVEWTDDLRLFVFKCLVKLQRYKEALNLLKGTKFVFEMNIVNIVVQQPLIPMSDLLMHEQLLYYKQLVNLHSKQAEIHLQRRIFMFPSQEHFSDLLRLKNESNYQNSSVSHNIKVVDYNKSILSSVELQRWNFMNPHKLTHSKSKSVMHQIIDCKSVSEALSQLQGIIKRGDGYWRVYLLLYRLLLKSGYKKSATFLIEKMPSNYILDVWKVWHYIFVEKNSKKASSLLDNTMLESQHKTLLLKIINSSIIDIKEDSSILEKLVYFTQLYDKDEGKAVEFIKSQNGHHRYDLILESIE
eukprot:NODE_11_length_54881_cov_1.430718.p2 type:complete len:1290 gc:universal NODE_11_length_54881_cov_1.430718:48531-44662(-)